MKLQTYLKKHKYSVFRTKINEGLIVYYSGQVLIYKILDSLGCLGANLRGEVLDLQVLLFADTNELIIIRENSEVKGTRIFLVDNSLKQ